MEGEIGKIALKATSKSEVPIILSKLAFQKVYRSKLDLKVEISLSAIITMTDTNLTQQTTSNFDQVSNSYTQSTLN